MKGKKDFGGYLPPTGSPVCPRCKNGNDGRISRKTKMGCREITG